MIRDAKKLGNFKSRKTRAKAEGGLWEDILRLYIYMKQPDTMMRYVKFDFYILLIKRIFRVNYVFLLVFIIKFKLQAKSSKQHLLKGHLDL